MVSKTKKVWFHTCIHFEKHEHYRGTFICYVNNKIIDSDD